MTSREESQDLRRGGHSIPLHCRETRLFARSCVRERSAGSDGAHARGRFVKTWNRGRHREQPALRSRKRDANVFPRCGDDLGAINCVLIFGEANALRLRSRPRQDAGVGRALGLVGGVGACFWGMISVLSYGRLVARAVLGGLSQTDSRDYSLVTASCGFGKDFRKGILKKGMCYGDDACFIARHRSADVLGEYGLVWSAAAGAPGDRRLHPMYMSTRGNSAPGAQQAAYCLRPLRSLSLFSYGRVCTDTQWRFAY